PHFGRQQRRLPLQRDHRALPGAPRAQALLSGDLPAGARPVAAVPRRGAGARGRHHPVRVPQAQQPRVRCRARGHRTGVGDRAALPARAHGGLTHPLRASGTRHARLRIPDLTMTTTGGPVLTLSSGPDVRGGYEEKRSRFVGVLRRVDDESAARDLVTELRRAHPGARHHCSAFLVDVPGANRIERASDDGEPSGTAGTPMVEGLRGSGLSGVCVVVVRWFGGTKLGTGGLVRAYGAAVSAALDEAWRTSRVVKVTHMPAWATEVDHAVAGGLESALRDAGAQVVDVEYGRRARMTVAGAIEVIDPILATRTSGGAHWELAGETTTENAAEPRDVES